MPALQRLCTFYQYAFLRHTPRRYALMLTPAEAQRLGQKYDERRGLITDVMITCHLAGAITLAAPAAVDGRAHLLPLDIDIPRRLIIELRDNQLALALYCWIARLYLVVQSPVPLSRSDVQKFDPSTKSGAIKRAFDRLIDGGWLIETSGHKSHYTPVWGKRRGSGAPHPWKIGEESLGCPRRIAIEAIRIDRAILDVYMGRFRPSTRNVLVESYFSQPLLRLLDVGAYILVAAGLEADDTKMLQQWGLVCDGAIQPIPDDAVVVALASHHASIDGFKLTEEGWRKLGWGTTRRSQQQET